MKMKFKYLSMFACAALIAGLTSCSDKNENEGQGPDEVAEETTMSIFLKPMGERVGTRAVSEYPATAEERIIYNARVYVFNSNKVLQQIEDLNVNTSTESTDQTTTQATKTFKTSVGTKYFIAVANWNQSSKVNVPIGTSLDNVIQVIEDVNRAKLTTFLDPGNAEAAKPLFSDGKIVSDTKHTGFFMTSGVDLLEVSSTWYRAIDYVTTEVVTEKDPRAPINNNVIINIGRAMGKTSVKMEVKPTDSPSTGVFNVYEKDPVTGAKTTTVMGTIQDLKFIATNNPTKMHYMPFFGTLQRFQTPEWTFYDSISAPQTYWPALHEAALTDYTTTTAKYGPISGPANGNIGFDYKPVLNGDPANQTELLKSTFYIVENTNKYATYGNTTIAQIRAKFVPVAAFGTAASDGTYYRVWEQNDPVLGDGKWRTDATTSKISFWASAQDAIDAVMGTAGKTKDDLKAIDCYVKEYKGGICYYLIPLRNTYLQDPTTDDDLQRNNDHIVYSVMRNHYYDISVTGITDSGYPGPGGKQPDDKDPGPGDQTEPKDPLDPEGSPYITVRIEVKKWVWVKQSEEIGIRD